MKIIPGDLLRSLNLSGPSLLRVQEKTPKYAQYGGDTPNLEELSHIPPDRRTRCVPTGERDIDAFLPTEHRLRKYFAINLKMVEFLPFKPDMNRNYPSLVIIKRFESVYRRKKKPFPGKIHLIVNEKDSHGAEQVKGHID